jgi:hypothetical protein
VFAAVGGGVEKTFWGKGNPFAIGERYELKDLINPIDVWSQSLKILRAYRHG